MVVIRGRSRRHGAASAQATTERVSVDSSGGEGSDNSVFIAFGSPGSTGIAVSADGNGVAFGSDASNLVAGDIDWRRPCTGDSPNGTQRPLK
jgi:hypothetical protein